jgi:hypothetical protein
MGVGRRLGRVAAATALTVGLVGAAVGPGSPAGAASLPLACTAVGRADHIIDAGTGEVTWTITGQGECTGDFGGPYAFDFTGSGTSKGLGTCTGDATLQDLRIDVTGTIRSIATGTTRTIDQTWAQSQAVFPGPAAFAISGSDDGIGELTSRIFGNCPPAGTVATRYTLAFAGK